MQSAAKIFRALEKIRVEKIILKSFYELNICQIMIFGFYAVYNKYEMIKIGNHTREKIANIIASARTILLPTVFLVVPFLHSDVILMFFT